MSILANRNSLKKYSQVMSACNANNMKKAINNFFTENTIINVCHPFNKIIGSNHYIEKILNPLLQSFEELHRNDYISLSGDFEGREWVSCTGYYVGNFTNNWLGIKANNRLSYLRFGEFHCMENGKSVESYIFLDIPELMIACNQWPIQSSPSKNPGYSGYIPGPSTHNGLQWENTDKKFSQSSLKIVEEMLIRLATKEESWRSYWHKNMLWYGPGAFGSFVGLENFAGFQIPFENTFQPWKGGFSVGSKTKHFVRFGDGNYVCSGGWPSLSGVHIKFFLDQKATNKEVYMRVCDWWRRDGELLIENWVFVDILDVLLQIGYDVFRNLEN